MRPAAGIVGVAVHPFQGLWKEVQSSLGRSQERQQVTTRIADGIEAVRNSTPAQRSEIFRKFKDAKPGEKARQQKYKDAAEKVMFEEAHDKRSEHTRDDTSPIADLAGSPSSSPRNPVPPRSDLLASQPPEQTASDDDLAFQRDLELAKQLSLAEQRGYERGVNDRRKGQ